MEWDGIGMKWVLVWLWLWVNETRGLGVGGWLGRGALSVPDSIVTEINGQLDIQHDTLIHDMTRSRYNNRAKPHSTLLAS